jgi:beta-lactamase superfamily II metal-dependent hydrolase
VFELFSLQAEEGDAFLIRYGDTAVPHYLMVDGGPAGTADTIIDILDSWRGDQDLLELQAIIVTHYDLDHIEGVIDLLKNKPAWLAIKDVWFNGLCHLLPPDLMGPATGDELSALIKDKFPWNQAFGNRAIKMSSAEPIGLAGDLKVWVLSPGGAQLSNLADEWRSGKLHPRDEGGTFAGDALGKKDTWPPGEFISLASSKTTPDGSVPNGSSIALMLEFREKKVLLTGDAYSHVVEAGIRRCWESPPKVELAQLAHHGSQANTSSVLLRAMDCKRYLISTSGKKHAHPDNALIARLLANVVRPEIIFNYVQKRTLGWQTVPEAWPSYTAIYPREGESFVCVDVLRIPDSQ